VNTQLFALFWEGGGGHGEGRSIHLCDEVTWAILLITGVPENVLAERKP